MFLVLQSNAVRELMITHPPFILIPFFFVSRRHLDRSRDDDGSSPSNSQIPYLLCQQVSWVLLGCPWKVRARHGSTTRGMLFIIRDRRRGWRELCSSSGKLLERAMLLDIFGVNVVVLILAYLSTSCSAKIARSSPKRRPRDGNHSLRSHAIITKAFLRTSS